MQTMILFVTLILMGLLAFFCLRAIRTTEAAEIPPSSGRTRTKLLWAMVVVGLIVTVASLREWPHKAAASDAMIVHVTGGQWWWDIDTTEIPLGKEIEFHVTTEDVNHGFGIYNEDYRLLFQVQAMPGYTNRVVHTFNKAGTYRVLCLEICGVGHHNMVDEFEVVEINQ